MYQSFSDSRYNLLVLANDLPASIYEKLGIEKRSSCAGSSLGQPHYNKHIGVSSRLAKGVRGLAAHLYRVFKKFYGKIQRPWARCRMEMIPDRVPRDEVLGKTDEIGAVGTGFTY
jgi:hypothetical protein